MSRSRGYVFTINNYTFKDICSVVDLTADYIVFGFETGNSKEVPHIQGYVHFNNARHFKSVSKMLPRAAIYSAKGTPQQNLTYCSKQGEFYEFGELPQQGKCKMERIEAAMSDPRSDFHIYHIYKKSYNDMLRKEKEKDHLRILNIIRFEDRYYYSKRHSTVSFDSQLEAYDNEEALFLPAYLDKLFVEDWCNDWPCKVKRGYEIITVDPEYIYLMYTDIQERNYLLKKYSEYIDNVYDEKEPEEIQS